MTFTRKPTEAHQYKFAWAFQTFGKFIRGGAFLLIEKVPNLSGDNSDFHDHGGLLLEQNFFANNAHNIARNDFI